MLHWIISNPSLSSVQTIAFTNYGVGYHMWQLNSIQYRKWTRVGPSIDVLYTFWNFYQLPIHNSCSCEQEQHHSLNTLRSEFLLLVTCHNYIEFASTEAPLLVLCVRIFRLKCLGHGQEGNVTRTLDKEVSGFGF